MLKAENPEWLADHKVNLLLQTGIEKNVGLEDLPRMVDLAKSGEDRRLLEIFASPSVVGRSFAAPPGLPKDRIEELRRGFMAVATDPEFVAEVARIKFDLDPLPGDQLQAFFSKADYPPSLLQRAREVAKLAGEH